jgi:lysophospholipase L1-like esterase
MRLRTRRLLAIALGVGAAVLLLCVAEFSVRALGLGEPDVGENTTGAESSGFVMDPLLGARPQPGWSGLWYGKFPVIIDDDGFRSHGVPPPPVGAPRVAFIGDSCTFGWGMDTEDTFVARLATTLAARGLHYELVNAGFPGDSAVGGRYVFTERVLPKNPDLVVVGFSANNAFRYTAMRESRVYRNFTMRKWFSRSRLAAVAAAAVAGDAPPALHPRTAVAYKHLPYAQWDRVASADEFEAALRDIVRRTRSSGAEALFLLFPRASEVSTAYLNEDAAVATRSDPHPSRASDESITEREIMLIGFSCLDHRATDDPAGLFEDRYRYWQPVFPTATNVRAKLSVGAEAYVNGDYARAVARFERAVELDPKSPLALYDLGVAKIANGQTTEGLASLESAETLACNVFLQYQVRIWRVALELDVEVVDLMLHFQTRDASSLFIDAAHPSAEGHALISDALLPTVAAHFDR